MEIKFKVYDQTIRKESSKIPDLHPGSRKSAYLALDFDNSWQSTPARIVGFSHDGIRFDRSFEPVKNGKCLIPDEYCDSDFFFKVMGKSGQRILTTEIQKVRVG